MEMSEQELNITKLRKEKRPLWMSDLAIDDYSDIVGNGGDIYTDRLPPAWPRHTGMELTEEEEREVGPVNLEEFRQNMREPDTVWSEPSYAETYKANFGITGEEYEHAPEETVRTSSTGGE